GRLLSGQILHAAEPAVPGSMERRLGVEAGEHVLLFVPGPAQEVALAVAGAVEAPLLDVAGHVVGAERSHSLVLPDLRQPGAPEVTPRDDLARQPEPTRPQPVVDRRQGFAGELGVGGGLVPTDARDRVLALAVRVASQLPGRRPRAPRGVAELGHGLLPRQ